MKKKIFLSFLGLTSFGMLLAACNGGHGNVDPSQGIPDLDIAKKVVDYTAGTGKDKVFASSGYGNGDPFNVTWNAANVIEGEKELKMKITDAPEGNEYPYYGGELRSLEFFGYGDFGVRMKPAKTTGTASTFFLYTGEWDSETLHPSTGETDTKNPDNAEGKHDEIDIEFLGKDTTKVQFNYFTSGQGGHEYMYDLGFDASLEYHDYGFRWEEGKITWFVDNKAVYSATSNIPTHPGRMISNFWTGSDAARMWMGGLDKENLHDASYQWLSSSVQGKETHKVPGGDPVDPTDVIDWTQYQANPLSDYTANDDYTCALADDGNLSLDVTYTNIEKNWHNVAFPIPAGASASRYVSFKVENKGTEAVAVRGDAMGTTKRGEHEITVANVSASQDGALVPTDLEWGGSSFTIQPGKTSLCQIKYDEAITSLQLMIDSHVDGTQSGHVVISDLKIKDYTPVAPAPEVIPVPAKPADVSDAQAIVLDIGGDTGADKTYQYLASDDGKAMNVVYYKVAQTWKNINTGIPAGAADSRKVSFKVTNNGEETVAIRGNAMAGTSVVNASAKQDGEDVRTDTEWGGSFFSIAAGATATCEITYSEAIDKLEFMIDSHIEGRQTGNVTISTVKLDGYDPSVTPEPEPDPAPATSKPADVTDAEAVELTDLKPAESVYNTAFSDDNKAVNVTYSFLKRDYQNINFAVPAAAATNNTLSFKVTNNGTAAVAIRGNANAATPHGTNNIYAINVSAKQDGTTVNTDAAWGGSFFSIAAGATATCEITYDGELDRIEFMIDSHTGSGAALGNITISTLKFYTPEAPVDPVIPTSVDWTELNPVALDGLGGDTTTYTTKFSENKVAVDVKYTNVPQNYNNINFTVPSDAADSRVLSFKVENKGTESVVVRGNANGSTPHHMQGENEVWAYNLSAKQDGTTVNTDAAWGGSYFTIGAGETALCEITYSASIARVEFMIDSTREGTQSGHVVISELKFNGVVRDAVDPAESAIPDDPEPTPTPTPTPDPDPTPTKPADVSNENAVALTDVDGNVGEGETYQYLLSDDTKAINVVYKDVGQNYHNFHVAVPASASESRTLSFKVTNNGTAAVSLRGDANGSTPHHQQPGETPQDIMAYNVSATQDGVAVTTDPDWGGSYFTIPAGQTVLCEITYSTSIVTVQWMIDSYVAGTQSGDVTISELVFAAPTPEPTPTPTPTPDPDPVGLTFEATGVYSVNATDPSAPVITYSETSAWGSINASINNLPENANTISFLVTNNDTTDSLQIHVDVIKGDGWKNLNVVRGDVAYDYITADLHAQYNIAAGESRTVTFAFDGAATHLQIFIDSFNETKTNGSLTISNIAASVEEPDVTLLNFASTDKYTVTKGKGIETVTYTLVTNNSYKNINDQSIATELKEGDTAVSFELLNRGAEDVVIEAGLYSYPAPSYSEVKHLVNSEEYENHDYFSGDRRAKYTIQPNRTKTIVLVFEGEPTSLQVMINSAYAATDVEHPDGNIVISNVKTYTYVAA